MYNLEQRDETLGTVIPTHISYGSERDATAFKILNCSIDYKWHKYLLTFKSRGK